MVTHAVRVAGMLLAVTTALGLGGCATASDSSQDTSPSVLSGSITVFAAASLTATFTELAEEFESMNPGTSVALTFAGSADLATQIVEGAPADVFASADETNMDRLLDEDLLAGAPVDFATNVLEIVVPPTNPAGVGTFADLARPGLKLVVCAPRVPCGAAAAKIQQSTGVVLHPVSEESSVTDVLGKVRSGEADAGLVYVTDIIGAGDDVEGIEFDESRDARTSYPIASLTESDNAELADAFVAFIVGETGQSVLAAAGFGPSAGL